MLAYFDLTVPFDPAFAARFIAGVRNGSAPRSKSMVTSCLAPFLAAKCSGCMPVRSM